MDNIVDESGEWLCHCGNTITEEGFWPCKLGTGMAWEVTYDDRDEHRLCAKCGRIMDQSGNVVCKPLHTPRTTKPTV